MVKPSLLGFVPDGDFGILSSGLILVTNSEHGLLGKEAMEIGIDSFGAVISDPATGLTLSPVQRTQNLLEEIALADKVGLDVFGVGDTIAASLWIQPRL